MLGLIPSSSLNNILRLKGDGPCGRESGTITGERRLPGHFITVLRMMKGTEISSDELSSPMILLEKRTKWL